MATGGKEDESVVFEGGDLGDGKGLRPGGLPKASSELDLAKAKENELTKSMVTIPEKLRLPPQNCADVKDDERPKSATIPEKITEKLKWLRKVKSEDSSSSEDISHLPAYASVPLGTSLRQQKKLFQHEVQDLFHPGGDEAGMIRHVKGMKDGDTDKSCQSEQEFIQKKLLQAYEEIDTLKQDLEMSKKQLDAKYRAIKILQKQSCNIQDKHNDSVKKVKQLNQKLQQEINELQFELEYKQSTLMDSQQLWAARFDRMCQENASLATAVEQKSDELRRVKAEKMAIARERDELLALLDIQERQRYEFARTAAASQDDGYHNFSSGELAILGACRCRLDEPDPCGCAHAAVNFQRDIMRLKEEVSINKKRREEALVTTDAYRIAFEEQLTRNRALLKHVAHLTAYPPQMSRSQKFKAAVKWLIKQMNEDLESPTLRLTPNHDDTSRDTSPIKNGTCTPPAPVEPPGEGKMSQRSSLDPLPIINPNDSAVSSGTTVAPPTAGSSGTASPSSTGSYTPIDINGCFTRSTFDLNELDSKHESELIQMLVDMVTDKSEALAHQRLAARMLASRTQELEEKLTAMKEESEDFF